MKQVMKDYNIEEEANMTRQGHSHFFLEANMIRAPNHASYHHMLRYWPSLREKISCNIYPSSMKVI